MRRTALALATALCGVAFAGPALADVTVKATVEKTKTVDVNESITVSNTVAIFVLLGEQVNGEVFSHPVSGAAEALAVVNQRNEFNRFGAGSSDALPDDPEALPQVDVDRRSRIYDSINWNSGIFGVNQDSGGNNNQGNVVAMAFSDLPDFIVHAESGGEQINDNNVGAEHQEFPGDPLGSRLIEIATDPGFINPGNLPASIWAAVASIEGSINGNLGIVGVNQSAGANNNQVNEFAAAIGADVFETGEGDPVALSESALGQQNSNNRVIAANTFRKDELFGSVNNNHGVIGVNQTAGFNNNQAGVVSVAAMQSATTIASGFVGGNPNPIP